MDKSTNDLKVISSSDIEKLKKLQKRLNGWGIFLIVIGSVGLLSLFVLLVYFGIKQSTSILQRTWPFIYNLISIVISSLIMSAGIYMYNTSKSIKQSLNKCWTNNKDEK